MPKEQLHRCAISLKTLCICTRWLRHTHSRVLSAKLMPEHFMVETVEHYHNDDDFSIGETAISMIIPFYDSYVDFKVLFGGAWR